MQDFGASPNISRQNEHIFIFTTSNEKQKVTPLKIKHKYKVLDFIKEESASL